MKTLRSILAVILVLSLALVLCACGGQAATPKVSIPSAKPEVTPEATPEPTPEIDTWLNDYAGEYGALCARFSPAYIAAMLAYEGELPAIDMQYVDYPNMAGYSVTLNSDGTGYLNWGEDNQGPIDSWSMEGTSLHFKAGVADISGSIESGIMTVKLDEGFELCFVLPGADTSAIQAVSLDEFLTRFSEPQPVYPVEGEYLMFAIEREGYLVDSHDLEMTSILTLGEGGTGYLVFNDDGMEISSWVLDGETLTIVMLDGGSAEASLRDGILILDIMGTGESLIYYALEGRDLSSFKLMTLAEYQQAIADGIPDSMLYALWSRLDQQDAAHLQYDMHTEYMDATQSFDVHYKNGLYYSLRTTKVSGIESSMAVFFRDGTAYNLYPDSMTGITVTTTSSSFIADNILQMDKLYAGIAKHAKDRNYTVETREFNGVSCTVEVFPATAYDPEAAFYFDAAGQLVGFIEAAPVNPSIVDIGESVFTVRLIDSAVNEALFDISGYTIS